MAGRTSPAVDHYGGVVVSMDPHGFDKLNESAARLWDAVLGPRCVVEVTNQNVVAVLRKSSVHKRQSKLSTVRFADYCCSDRMYSHSNKKRHYDSIQAKAPKCSNVPMKSNAVKIIKAL